MKLLKKEPVQLSILGQPSMPMDFYRKQFSEFEYYSPCSNSEVRNYASARNAGGTDLIIEGITGYLIPIRSPEEIEEKPGTL